MGTQHRRQPGSRAEWLYALTHWNWKISLLTAILRGLACVWALRNVESHARNHFGLVEAAFVLATCGFFSALQQQSLKVRRELLAWLACVVVIPMTALGCDAALHFWLDGRDTLQLGTAGIIFTLVSATFHWHLIRNGALLVGEDSGSLATDLKRIPRLTMSYCTAPVLWMSRLAGSSGKETAEESAAFSSWHVQRPSNREQWAPEPRSQGSVYRLCSWRASASASHPRRTRSAGTPER